MNSSCAMPGRSDSHSETRLAGVVAGQRVVRAAEAVLDEILEYRDPHAGYSPPAASIRSSEIHATRSTARSPTRPSPTPTPTSTSSAPEEYLAGGAGPEAAALDRQDRRHGRAAKNDRHRRPPRQDAAGGAALPPPLRRGLVDGRALERLPHEGLVDFAKPLGAAKYVVMQTFQDPRWPAASASSGIRGPISRG